MNGVQIATSVLTLIAGVGIFLTACTMMSANLEALSSKKLKALFKKTSKSKLVGVGVGTVATAAIQSSGATTVMVIGFVNAGIMTLAQAATVIFGANIGTTITGQLAALGLFGGDGVSTSVIFAAFAGVGAFISVFAKKDVLQKTGGILVGFGMLFVGLSMMSGAMSYFSELDAVRNFLATFTNPLVLVIIGMILTAVVQSSSVMTTMAITMVATGLITLNQGIYMTMGSNIGSCVTALLAGLASTKNAKRTAMIHLIFNVSGVVVFVIVGLIMSAFGIDFGYLFGKMFPHAPQIQLSMFHTIFNVVTVAMVLPLTNVLVKLVTKIVRDKKSELEAASELKLDHVEEHMLKSPPIAVQQVKAEILGMAELSVKNFDTACGILRTLDYAKLEGFKANEKKLNFLNAELAKFIARLLKSELADRDRNYLSTAFRSIVDLERVGDYAENIIEYADKLKETGETFSDSALAEIDDLCTRIKSLYGYAVKAYSDSDVSALSQAYAVEDSVDGKTKELTENHISRLNDGACNAEAGMLYLSFVANAERVADHYMNFAKSIKTFA